jgi:hypothetical protein
MCWVDFQDGPVIMRIFGVHHLYYDIILYHFLKAGTSWGQKYTTLIQLQLQFTTTPENQLNRGYFGYCGT